MKRLMLDIETLSTRKNAAVLSIGGVEFDDTSVIDSFGWAMNMRQITGHIDPGTVQWWLKQNESARAFSFSGDFHPEHVAGQLYLRLAMADEIWANDPDFDLVILQDWMERLGKTWPVSFRKYRSVRTIRMLAERYYIDLSTVWNGLTAHNPIDDAAAQARAVIEVFKALDRRHGEMLR